MKDSAVTHATHEVRPDEQSPESAFQRFAKTMRALVAVPKHELAEKLTEFKKKKAKVPPPKRGR
jgi:hypothetical protein